MGCVPICALPVACVLLFEYFALRCRTFGLSFLPVAESNTFLRLSLTLTNTPVGLAVLVNVNLWFWATSGDDGRPVQGTSPALPCAISGRSPVGLVCFSPSFLFEICMHSAQQRTAHPCSMRSKSFRPPIQANSTLKKQMLSAPLPRVNAT